MIEQLTLDDAPTVRATDPDTSQAPSVEQRLHHEAIALRVHQVHPAGLTDFELADITGIPQTSVGVRRKALERKGYVVKTDRRRPSPSGRPAIVWQVTHTGSRVQL